MRFVNLTLALLSAACSTAPRSLLVKPYSLRDEKFEERGEPLITMEKERRLHGAISMAERKQRLGQYYTVIWNDASPGPATVTFQYLQGKSASRKKFKKQVFPAGQTSGIAEFSVIGDDYFNHGRVTAWKISLSKNGRSIAAEQSYLWE